MDHRQAKRKSEGRSVRKGNLDPREKMGKGKSLTRGKQRVLRQFGVEKPQ